MSPEVLDLINDRKRNSSKMLPNLEEASRIMSFNICWDNKEEFENCWTSRKNIVASMIRFHRVDLVGLQEPLYQQMEDLQALLPEYSWLGVGLEDGKKKGPFDAVMYRKERYRVIDSSCFFLSSTPDKPSKGWNAKFHRGVTWVFFEDQKTSKKFFFFNTHFDYHSREARNESAYMLRQKITSLSHELPFVVTGDFNLFPLLGGGHTYQILVEQQSEPDLAVMVDAQYVSEFPHHGPTGSWSGFQEPGQPGIKPDCIFVDPKIRVVTHGILTDTFDGNKFPSDHLPVVTDIIL